MNYKFHEETGRVFYERTTEHVVSFVSSNYFIWMQSSIDNKPSDQISGETEIISDPLPVQWIFYNEEKYTFNSVIPKEEVDISLIESTGT